MKTYKVITLCGSLKLAEKEFNQVQILLERKGHVCFGVCSSAELEKLPNESEKKILDMRMITMMRTIQRMIMMSIITGWHQAKNHMSLHSLSGFRW